MSRTRLPLSLASLVVVLAVASSGCIIAGHSDPTPTTGQFTVVWNVQTDQGVASSCAGVGGDTVHLDLQEVSSQLQYHDSFGCAAGQGRSSALPVGTYSVALRLYNAAGDLLSEWIAPTTYQIVSGGTTPLGTVVFAAYPVDNYFQLSWEIHKKATGAVLTCAQADGQTVQLTTQLAGASALVYPFTCADGAGRTTTVAPGTYTISVQLVDSAMKVISSTGDASATIVLGKPLVLDKVVFDVN